MNLCVKKFIESNIEQIEKNDWKTVFDCWYADADYDFSMLDQDFLELLEILSVIEPDILQKTQSVRESIIYDSMYDVFEELLSKSLFVYKHDLKHYLASHLGFSDSEIDDIIATVAHKEFKLIEAKDFYEVP